MSDTDTILYQNWLLKRSDVTRLFKKRFSLLTRGGRLYSFRKVDVTRAIDLANASMTWDVRGCSVEFVPRLGKHTWLVKTLMNEEIYLRACAPFTESATMHWMRMLSAVSRDDLDILQTFSNLSIVIQGLPEGKSFFAELEGSLHSLEWREGAYSADIPVRSSDPASILVVKQFSAHDESCVAQSGYIPRFRFQKTKIQLPVKGPNWEPILISGSGSSLSGAIRLQVDEGVDVYSKPRPVRVNHAEDVVDLASFKFQIQRLVRIIDRIGIVRKSIVRIFEWEDPAVSLTWLVYLGIVLCFLPSYAPALILCHCVYSSLLRNPGMVEMWDNVVTDRLSPGPPPDATSLAPESPQLTPTPRADGIEGLVNTVASKLRRGHSPTYLKNEIWENQRRVVGGNQFAASHLSVFDRSRWSDETGKVALDPPGNVEAWKIDVDSPQCDDNGWTYNFRWGADGWHPSFTGWDFVRRRRWVPATTVPSSPQSIPVRPPSLDEIVDSNVASVSAVPEFGLGLDEYDTSSHSNQPKQVGSIGSIYQDFRNTAAVARTEIAEICASFERLMSLFSWEDPFISSVAVGALLLVTVSVLVVPVNILVFLGILSRFHVGFRSHKWKMVPITNVTHSLENGMLCSISLRDMNGMDAHRLCLAINSRYGTHATQKVVKGMTSAGDLARWLVNNSKSFGKSRSWVRRDLWENFMDLVPPQVSDELNIFFPKHPTNPSHTPNVPQVPHKLEEVREESSEPSIPEMS
jgi:hypothetical protein